MLITVTPPYDPALLHPQISPPAVLPKPGKDNLRLQRLLKKVAKKPALSSQQVKSFQTSLSPVSEASPDLERSARSSPLKTPETSRRITIHLPPRFSIKPITHHIPSPFPKTKPFTFKVNEQRRISEHLKLTVSPAASPVPRQDFLESPRQPKWIAKPDTPTQLPPTQTGCVFVFPDPPVSTSPIIEAPGKVTHVTEVHAHIHSAWAHTAKTACSDQSSTALSNADRQPSAVHTDESHSAPPSGKTPVILSADEAGVATPNSKAPTLPILTAGPPYKTTRPATPKECVRAALLSSTTQEVPGEVTHLTKMHAHVHSIQAPKAKTAFSDQAPLALGNEGSTSSVTQSEVSHSEPPLGQTPVPTNADKADVATPKSMDATLPTIRAQPPHKTLKSSTPGQAAGTASPVPQMPHPQFNRSVTPGSNTARSRTEWGPELPESHSKSLRPLTPHKAQKQEATVPDTTTKAFSTETGEKVLIPPQQTATFPSASPLSKVEPPLPSMDKARPLTAKMSGWSRLKKHLIVEPEVPQFPETEPAKPEEEAGSKAEGSQSNTSQDNKLTKSRATKMWDAILYQMTAIKKRKQQEEEKEIRTEEGFSFWCRLPLLHRPHFDARKLKELASKPMTKITTMLELSLIHSKTPEEPKNFNRAASGWQLK
uniref:Proline rich 33 n=1 Tax=Pelusios castaneus TaxID=367368 RepID=A0A8C8VPJ6_9SAUR